MSRIYAHKYENIDEHVLSIEDAIDGACAVLADALRVDPEKITIEFWNWRESPACGLRVAGIIVDTSPEDRPQALSWAEYGQYDPEAATLLFLVERYILDSLLGEELGGCPDTIELHIHEHVTQES